MQLIIGIVIIISFFFYYLEKVQVAYKNYKAYKKGTEKLSDETKAVIVYLIGIPLLILWIAFLVTR